MRLSLAALTTDQPDNLVKFLLAGAEFVQSEYSLRRQDPQHRTKLIAGLTDWLDANDAGSVTEIRGRMRADANSQDAVMLQDRAAMLIPRESTGGGLFDERIRTTGRAQISVSAPVCALTHDMVRADDPVQSCLVFTDRYFRIRVVS